MYLQLDRNTIPHNVWAVASDLRSAGGKAFLVGGPVRDLLLKTLPKDWDIATDLPPSHVVLALPSAVTVGIEFGRVQVSGVDVVSLRSESGYLDGRHPSSVSFGASLEQDLCRRDFTVNAMAAEFPDLEVVDPFGGMADLASRVLRTVGAARERLTEDPLRILRAIRFKTTMGMNLEPCLASVLPQISDLLTKVSGERIYAELRRMLQSPGVYQGILDLDGYGLGRVVLPEAFSCEHERVETTARAVSMSPPDLHTRLALLFWFAGRTAAEKAFGRFNLDNAARERVSWILRHAEAVKAPDLCPDLAYEARVLAEDGGWANVYRLVDFQLAAWRAIGRDGLDPRAASLIAGIVLAGERLSGSLALSGSDVMRITGAEGRLVGEALSFLRDLVLRDPGVNSRGRLEDAVREWWDKR